MFNLFVMLALFSGLAMLAGALWLFLQAREATGNGAGDEAAPAPERQPGRRREAAIDLPQLGQEAGAGRLSRVAPPLLAAGGLLGLLLFGSLAAYAALENKLVGVLLVASALLALVRVALALARNWRA